VDGGAAGHLSVCRCAAYFIMLKCKVQDCVSPYEGFFDLSVILQAAHLCLLCEMVTIRNKRDVSIDVTRGHVRVTVVAVDKTISFTYYMLEVAIFIQHAKRMRRVMLSSVARLALPYFPRYLVNSKSCGKKYIEHKTCVLIFSTTFV